MHARALDAAVYCRVHAHVHRSGLPRQGRRHSLTEGRPEFVLVLRTLLAREGFQLLPELDHQPVLSLAVRHVKELSVELRELARSEVALIGQGVTFQAIGALAQHLTRGDVVLHHRRHAIALDGTDLHADAATQIVGHHGTAALEDQFVLFHAPVPDLLWHQGAPGAAVHAHLAHLAELMNAVVYRLVIGHIGIGEEDLQPRPRAEVGRQQLPIGPQLAQAGLDKHGNHGAVVQRRTRYLDAVAERADV